MLINPPSWIYDYERKRWVLADGQPSSGLAILSPDDYTAVASPSATQDLVDSYRAEIDALKAEIGELRRELSDAHTAAGAWELQAKEYEAKYKRLLEKPASPSEISRLNRTVDSLRRTNRRLHDRMNGRFPKVVPGQELGGVR